MTPRIRGACDSYRNTTSHADDPPANGAAQQAGSEHTTRPGSRDQWEPAIPAGSDQVPTGPDIPVPSDRDNGRPPTTTGRCAAGPWRRAAWSGAAFCCAGLRNDAPGSGMPSYVIGSFAGSSRRAPATCE